MRDLLLYPIIFKRLFILLIIISLLVLSSNKTHAQILQCIRQSSDCRKLEELKISNNPNEIYCRKELNNKSPVACLDADSHYNVHDQDTNDNYYFLLNLASHTENQELINYRKLILRRLPQDEGSQNYVRFYNNYAIKTPKEYAYRKEMSEIFVTVNNTLKYDLETFYPELNKYCKLIKFELLGQDSYVAPYVPGEILNSDYEDPNYNLHNDIFKECLVALGEILARHYKIEAWFVPGLGPLLFARVEGFFVWIDFPTVNWKVNGLEIIGFDVVGILSGEYVKNIFVKYDSSYPMPANVQLLPVS